MNRNQCGFARRWSRELIRIGIASSVCLLLVSRQADAGFLVGTGTGNDSKPEVIAIIDVYNAANDPDLRTNIDLFKKTDDDKTFVFDMDNGFMFFADAAGTVPVTTEGQLTSLSTAYFKYTGPENLLFYSLKAGQNVSLYTFMAGLNIMNVSNQDLSHGSFWTGPPPIGDPFVPEPSTVVLLVIAGLALAAGQRRRRT